MDAKGQQAEEGGREDRADRNEVIKQPVRAALSSLIM